MPRTLKRLFIVFLFSLLLLGGGLFYIASDETPILFQSEESSTEQYGPIFNRISWRSSPTQDIWMMQQSQKGLNSNFKEWDRLAIVIDKTQTPKKARFIQTRSGPMDFSGHYKDVDFRVPCGMCHTNGPRAIRPTENSKSLAPLGWKDRMRVGLWNLRIKLYGRVVSDTPTHIDGRPRKVAFDFNDDFSKRTIDVHACTKCHNNSWWGRSFLQRQHFASIRFMIEKSYMPPPGFHFSEDEKREVLRLLE